MKTSELASKNLKMTSEVVYEVFIPFLYRGKTEEATKRRVFWVFKQLDWGYIWDVRVFGFDDETRKNVTARVSFSHINESAAELIAQLDAGETAQVHYEEGKPWFWNVVKYTRREKQKPQVTYTMKPKPTSSPSASSSEFKPIVKPSANKFKILPVEGAAASPAASDESETSPAPADE